MPPSREKAERVTLFTITVFGSPFDVKEWPDGNHRVQVKYDGKWMTYVRKVLINGESAPKGPWACRSGLRRTSSKCGASR